MAKVLVCPACRGRFTIRPGIVGGRKRVKCYDCSPQRLPKTNSATLKRLSAVADITPRVQHVGGDVLNGRDEIPRPAGEHERVVRMELERLGWLDTIEGVGAVGLAKSLDDGELPGAQRTSLLKQLRDVITEIRATAPREPDALDAWQTAARLKRDGAR